MKHKSILTQKTTYAGLFMVCSGIAGYLSGSLGPYEAIQMVGMGLATIFLRQAVNLGKGE